MKNFLSSIFNFGSISQNNTILISTTIDTQLKLIKRTFLEGKIAIAFNDILTAKKEYGSNEKAKYHLLMLETEFYLTLQNFTKVNENLEYIQKNFNKYLEIHFYEIQATLMALNNNKREFDDIILKIQKEFNDNGTSQEYYDMTFLLNSGQINEAKLLYDDFISRIQTKDKRLDYFGGILYSNLYLLTDHEEYITKSEQIFNNYLNDYETNIFEKLEIYKTFSYYIVNEIFKGKYVDNYNERVQNTKKILEIILVNISFFDHEKEISLKNHYLHCLWILQEIDLFIDQYRLMREEDIDSINFIAYNFDLFSESLDYKKVEEKILQNKIVLIPYLNSLLETNPKKLLSYIAQNEVYINDEIVLNIYVEAHILENKEIDTKTIQLIEKNKDSSLISFITFLYLKQQKDNRIEHELLDNLLKYFEDEVIPNILILKAMKLLSNNNRPKDFIELALKYKNNNKHIINNALDLILQDKNIYLIDCEKFFKEIDGVEFSIKIANIYMKFSIYSKAYTFYKTAWENLTFSDKSKIHFACTVLQNCSIQNFFKTQGSILNPEQDQIYLSFIESKIDIITIEECFVLSYYKIVIDKSYNIGFRHINKRLLKININDLSTQEKNMMSSLYFYTLTNIDPANLLVDSNITIKQEEQYYISNTLIENIHDSHHFTLLSKFQFDLRLQENNIENLSTFHQICNKFIYSMNNENFITIASTPEDPLGNLKEIIIQQANESKDTLLRYSEGINIPFYELSGKKYEAYFELIPTLYESNTITFDTGSNNPTMDSTKKILTLSSIIFIDYMKKLDIVLQRSDIFIQQTTVDFLLSFINTLNGKTEIFTVRSDGVDLFKNIADENDIKQSKDYLIYLATQISNYERIIDDRETVLAVADSERILAPDIGYLEYRALAYSFNYNYQIISEDRIFKVMFEELGFNMNMVSNSVFLLTADIADDIDQLVLFYKKLHSKKYKYILNEKLTKDLFQKFIFEEKVYLAKGYSGKLLKTFVSIAYSYGWMDGFENYYKNNYEFKIGMSSIPKKDFIARNIEYLREESNFFNEEDFPEQAILGLEQANDEAVLSNKKIYISEDGFIYEKSGKNEKKFLKKTEKRIPVDITKKLVLE